MFTRNLKMFMSAALQEELMLNANQIRAARALLNWSQNELVEKTGLSLTTIRRMEDEKIGPERSSAGNVSTVTKALEEAGVLFLGTGEAIEGGPGVRLGK
jgi:predicted transcriptional regulator